MLSEILLSLGMLLLSAPGLGDSMDVFEAIRPSPAAVSPMPLLHPTPFHGMPCPASLGETGFSDPEEKEEESDHFLPDSACDRGRIPANVRGEGTIAVFIPGHGFLRQLHHSWQLLC